MHQELAVQEVHHRMRGKHSVEVLSQQHLRSWIRFQDLGPVSGSGAPGWVDTEAAAIEGGGRRIA